MQDANPSQAVQGEISEEVMKTHQEVAKESWHQGRKVSQADGTTYAKGQR